MSSKAYQEAYKHMSDAQKDAVYKLWQGSVNHDGHAWATFTEIEDCIAEIVMDQRKLEIGMTLKKAYDLRRERYREYAEVYEEGYDDCKKTYRWHDLRKNPNDLPELGNRSHVPCLIVREYTLIPEYAEWEFFEGYGCFFCGFDNKTIVKWRELEPFEEDEDGTVYSRD